LTPRQLTVLHLLAEGLTAAAIASRLKISLHTVTKHQEHLYRKLGTSDRLNTVLLAQKLGILGRSDGDPIPAPYPSPYHSLGE
jgi:DNA-binding NarL/FixJ family response regulator